MSINIGIERSRNNRWIRGVCAGIAATLGINPMWVRLAFLLAAAVIPGITILPVIIIYVALGILLPESPVN